MSQEAPSLEEQMRERARRMQRSEQAGGVEDREASEPMDVDVEDTTAARSGEQRVATLQRSVSERNQKIRRLQDMRSQLEAQQAELQRKLESVAAAIREEEHAFLEERKELEDLVSAPTSMDTDEPAGQEAPEETTMRRQRSSGSSAALSGGSPRHQRAAASAAEQARLDEELARTLQAQYDREVERERNEAQVFGMPPVVQPGPQQEQPHEQAQAQQPPPDAQGGPTAQPFPQFSVRTENDGRGGHRRVVSFVHRSGGGPRGGGVLANPFFGQLSGMGMDSDEDDDPFGRGGVTDPFNLLGMRGFGFGGRGASLRSHFLPIHFGGMMGGPMGGGMLDVDGMDHDTLLRLFPPRPRGARRDDIEQLPTDTFRAPQPKSEHVQADTGAESKEESKEKESLDDENRKCCICLEQFADGDTIRRLPCLHIFHRDEIDEWLRRNHICPICRSPIEQNELPSDATQ